MVGHVMPEHWNYPVSEMPCAWECNECGGVSCCTPIDSVRCHETLFCKWITIIAVSLPFNFVSELLFCPTLRVSVCLVPVWVENCQGISEQLYRNFFAKGALLMQRSCWCWFQTCVFYVHVIFPFGILWGKFPLHLLIALWNHQLGCF